MFKKYIKQNMNNINWAGMVRFGHIFKRETLLKKNFEDMLRTEMSGRTLVLICLFVP